LNEGKPVSGGDLGNLVEVPPGMQDGAPDLGLVAAQKGSRRLAIPPHAPKVEIAAGEFVAETKVQGNLRQHHEHNTTDNTTSTTDNGQQTTQHHEHKSK